MFCACMCRRGVGGVQGGAINSNEFGGALVGAADWVRSLLTGSIALTVATLAVAGVGVMMLTGRIPARRTGQIVLGCFILFSAQAIAAGLVGLHGAPRLEPAADVAAATPAYQATVPALEEKDPFAGAAAPPPQQDDW